MHGYYFILDIDECLVPEYDGVICENGNCNNTIGSFTCQCDKGFIADRYGNCLGKYFVACA